MNAGDESRRSNRIISMSQQAPGHAAPSAFAEGLRWVTHAVSRRPKITLGVVLVLAVVAVAYTVAFMKFKTDRADLIDADAPFQRRWVEYTENFGDASDVVVVVEARQAETIKQVLDALGARLEQNPDLFRDVLYKFEPGPLRAKGLQYLPPTVLEEGLRRLESYAPVVQGRWELVQLEGVLQRLRLQMQPSGPAEQAAPLEAHALALAESLDRALADRHDFVSPWPVLVPADPRARDLRDEVVYLLNDSGTMGFLKVFPVQDAGDFQGSSPSIDYLRKLIAQLERRHPDAQIGLTGIPVLESDEMRRSQADMLQASLLSVVGVALLLLVGFRGFRHPMLALTMLAVGMAWSFGFTTAAIGHLNILSVSFAVVLIGLGIDFAIHYLARYLELRHEGHTLRPALGETSISVGPGIVTAAVTTALAFFCASFSDFQGVAELGIIAGGGIIICGATAFLVLPALIALADRRVEPRRLPTPFQGNGLRLLIVRHPLLVVLVSLGAIAYVTSYGFEWDEGHFESRVRYDHNLLHLQADGVESVEVQKRVFQGAQNSLLFAVSLASSREEALERKRQFEALPTVHHVEDLASRFPQAPHQNRLLVQGFAAQLAHLPEAPPPPAPADPSALGRALEDFYLALRERPTATAARATQHLNRFLDTFETLGVGEQVAFLSDYQYRMAYALLAQFQALRTAADPEPVTLEDFSPAVASRFVSPEGRWLLQVYPKDQIWDLEPLREFVGDIRSVDPEATGTPLQNYEATQQILQSYQSAAWYALAVICVVLVVDFLGREYVSLILLPPAAVVVVAVLVLRWQGLRADPALLLAGYAAMTLATSAVLDLRSLRDAALAMLPPTAGGALMLGLLGQFDVHLNPANLIVLPLILGIGVDDGVHVLHDFRYQRGRRYRISSSTINAILLTSLTSMIGFGSMMVASHRGLYSLGIVLVVGIGSCLFVSLVTLPAILTLLSRIGPSAAAASSRTGSDPHRASGKQSFHAA